MNPPNPLLSVINGFMGASQSVDWLFIYFSIKYFFLTLDLALLVGIVLLFRVGLSYRIKVDLKALPPTVAELLKKSGVRDRYIDRWKKLREDARVTPPASYTMAIMNADALVDELIQEVGFAGRDVAERFGRLNHIGLNQNVVNGIFRAHKIRNQIAHEPNFSLAAKDAERVLDLYERFLTEVKILV